MPSLLLPALLPSWRFFDEIAPAPYIEYAVCNDAGMAAPTWQPFQPRPSQLSPMQLLGRLFWNPARNEALYLVSCAERLLAYDCAQAEAELARRIARQVLRGLAITTKPVAAQRLQFRLRAVARVGADVESAVAYVSRSYALREFTTATARA